MPKKKPQTITEKATAPFLTEESAAPSLLQYFGTPVTESNEDHQNERHLSTVSKPKPIAQKPRSKATGKPTISKAKKKAEQTPKLLSPKTAMKSTTDQELIFGTSSQLVREESPTFIRNLQQAIVASEIMDEQSERILTKEASPNSRLCSYRVAAVTPFKSSRNLWSVAARDSDGSLLNTEVIDLVDTPQTCKPVPGGKLGISESEKPSLGIVTTEKELNIVEELSERDPSAYRKRLIEQNDFSKDLSIPRSLAEASLRDRPKSRSPVKKHKIRNDSDIHALELAPGQMPTYQGFTTIELSKEVAKYGFKAIKKRTEMIALLERCWESQSRIALQTLSLSTNRDEPSSKANTEIIIPKQASPKKKGRPRKASATASANKEATDDPSAKKSRGRPRKEKQNTSSSEKRAPLTQLPLAPGSIPPQVHASNPPADTIQPSATLVSIAPVSSPAPPSSGVSSITLLSRITQAITTFPPTHSSTNPTFYEMILLYDPIIIEDLTAWLNTEGLGRVGVDDEVSGLLVKEWCEQRSVCCFWRAEGWRATRATRATRA